jgi:hypothetical protein
MSNIYMYRIERGSVYLNKGDDSPLKSLGKFKNDEEAKIACEKHYEKACKGLLNLGRNTPKKYYV